MTKSTEKKPKKQAPKKKKGGRSPKKLTAPRITVSQYNALYRAYMEEPDVKTAAKAAGLKITVARWYTEGPGKPEVGLHPIGERLARVSRVVHDYHDKSAEVFRKEQLSVIDEALGTSAANLKLHRAIVAKRMAMAKKARDENLEVDVVPDSTLKQEAETFDKLARLGLLLYGEADSQPGSTGQGRYNFAEWTEEECVAYATKRIVPDRFQ